MHMCGVCMCDVWICAWCVCVMSGVCVWGGSDGSGKFPPFSLSFSHLLAPRSFRTERKTSVTLSVWGPLHHRGRFATSLALRLLVLDTPKRKIKEF